MIILYENNNNSNHQSCHIMWNHKTVSAINLILFKQKPFASLWGILDRGAIRKQRSDFERLSAPRPV